MYVGFKSNNLSSINKVLTCCIPMFIFRMNRRVRTEPYKSENRTILAVFMSFFIGMGGDKPGFRHPKCRRAVMSSTSYISKNTQVMISSCVKDGRRYNTTLIHNEKYPYAYHKNSQGKIFWDIVLTSFSQFDLCQCQIILNDTILRHCV